LLPTDENDMKIDKRMTDREKAEMDALTRAFLEKGGTITRCPPGSSETVTYRNNQPWRPTTTQPKSPLKQDAQAISASPAAINAPVDVPVVTSKPSTAATSIDNDDEFGLDEG